MPGSPAQDGIVVAQSPPAGNHADAGSTCADQRGERTVAANHHGDDGLTAGR